MNKRVIGVFLGILIILNVFMVYAQGPIPGAVNSPVSESDVQAINDFNNQLPIDNSGNLDQNKLQDWRSKADQRIESANVWLAKNASWLKVVLGMVPEVSWLFAISFYLFLLLLVIFVLNADLQIIPFFGKTSAQLAGAAVFVVLIVLKANFLIAKGLIWIVSDMIPSFLTNLAISATVILVINIITYLVCLIIFPATAMAIVNNIKKHAIENRKKLAGEEEKVNQEALKNLVKGTQEK